MVYHDKRSGSPWNGILKFLNLYRRGYSLRFSTYFFILFIYYSIFSTLCLHGIFLHIFHIPEAIWKVRIFQGRRVYNNYRRVHSFILSRYFSIIPIYFFIFPTYFWQLTCTLSFVVLSIILHNDNIRIRSLLYFLKNNITNS